MGVPMESIKEAIKRGISKVNVDTDSRLAITGAVRKYLNDHPDAFDPRTYFGEAREAVYRTVKAKMEDFSTAGHAGEYECMTLEDMKEAYSG
jgi:fructose-bisphosphate aldolase class II